MDLDEYISLAENPENIGEEHIADFRAMLEYAPYCATTRLLLLKALYKTHNIHYGAELPKTVLYASGSATLYLLLHPQDTVRRKTQHSGNYFEMLETMEKVGRSSNESLQEIAARLKAARQSLQQKSATTTTSTVRKTAQQEQIRQEQGAVGTLEISEENARRYIKNKQYVQAIEILRKLNLNNPEKSVYFADQIRFLEKALNINS